MNRMTVLTLGLMMTGTAVTAVAEPRDRENLNACNSDIQQALGEGTSTRLYGIQHRRNGDRLRLKVYPSDGDSQVLNCWVDDEGAVTLQTSDGVALRTPAFDGTEQVTLTD